ncbi:MAPK kinase substrate protein At1g80180-like [Apium graveolens]|uniref:MAPK kinase substrate protein At1g80180-like n=1 Tax=Apium graveolens TaxID=4045 RepID=UPI003D79C70D
MAALPRSEVSFRRSGSSGLVWEDQKYLSGELKPIKTKQDDDQDGVNHKNRRSDERKSYRTVDVTSTVDPPSPKVSGCGCFGKPAKKTNKRKPSAGHRRS